MAKALVNHAVQSGYIKLSFFAFFALVSTPVHAQDAADLIDLDSAPVIAPIVESSGWYLRGDLSTSVDLDADAAAFSTYSSGNGLRSGSISQQSYLDNDIAIGVGAGYHFNDVFRFDSTFDFLRGSGNLMGSSADNCSGAPLSTSCHIDGDSDFSSLQSMINVYADLATISGFTPYVGAGLGLTYVDWDNPDVTGTCVGSCGSSTSSSESYEGVSSWRNTLSLMAGVSYHLSDRVSADFGYRFSHIASGGQWSKDDGSFANDGGFDRHEIRFGIRFMQ